MHTNANSQTFDWVRQLRSPAWGEGTAITADDHYVYSAGNFSDTLDLGTSYLIPLGAKDVYISKHDVSGNLIWAKQIGGGWVECNGITADSNGNSYITGSFLGTVDFDPSAAVLNLTSGAEIHAFTCKLDASGNLVWAKHIGGSLAVNAYAIAVDDSGNVYTTGYFDGTADLDPGAGVFSRTVLGYSDMFVSKLDASGNFVWAKQMGGTVGEVGYAICVDANGSVYTTGIFVGTVDFDPGAGSFPLSTADPLNGDIFVSKLDASGNFVWAKQLGGEEAHGLAVDHAGNVYVGGSGYYTWNSIAVHKLDPSGNGIWTKEIMAYSCFALGLDDNQHVYITGQFYGTRDFDPGTGVFNLTAVGNADSYIAKLDSSGDFIWAKQLGGTEQVWSRSLAVNGNDNVYTTGYFSGTADFDPSTATANLTAISSYDIFIHKMKPENASVGETIPAGNCNIYPNPTGGKLMIEWSHEYANTKLVLWNMAGQIVMAQSIDNSDHAALDINGASGIYILEIDHSNGEKTVARIRKD